MSLLLERLSSLDRAFLTIEEGPLHMHVGAVAVLEGRGADGKGLVGPDGALDVTALRRLIAHGIARMPRLRQRVRFVPPLGTVWTPDPAFRLDFHVRHTAVPRPGTVEQLHALAGRVFSQRLDRERPLWEMWLVEGLADGRFGIILKAHHAMLDGMAGVAVLASLFSAEPTDLATLEELELGPEREPSRSELVLALARRRWSELPTLGERVRRLVHRTGRAETTDALRGAMTLAKAALTPARLTPINPPKASPHRAFGGIRLDLARLRAIRHALGGTLNEVALTIVSGALRTYLARRGEDPADLRELRAMVPVSIRGASAGTASTGNRVATLIVPLPIDEADPLRRLAKLRASSAELRHASHEVEAAALLEELGDLGPESLVGLVFSAALAVVPFHLIVTNVPGPAFPLFVGPCRVEALHPLVPLFARQALGIALLSYDGGLFVGLHTDPVAVPDGDVFARDLLDAEAALYACSNRHVR